MKSKRDTNKSSQSKTLKKIQNVQKFPPTYECLTLNSGKTDQEYHLPKYIRQDNRNSVVSKRPGSQRKSEEREFVEQIQSAIDENIFKSRGNLPFVRPEKNISGHFIIQDPRRKIFHAPKEVNQVKDYFKNSGLISQSNLQCQKSQNKQICGKRKVRHSSSPFLEELDRYIDDLDCQSCKNNQDQQLFEDQSEAYKFDRIYCIVENKTTSRDLRFEKILNKLMEQRKENQMIAYGLEMKDKKIKKMSQTATHMFQYIRQLKDKIASTKQEKEQHLKMFNEFVARYENARRSTQQQQNIYQEHHHHIKYDFNTRDRRLQPFGIMVSQKQSAGRLKKRRLGSRNLNNQPYFKGRESNRGSTTDFYSSK